jgi:hypothetical protein
MSWTVWSRLLRTTIGRSPESFTWPASTTESYPGSPGGIRTSPTVNKWSLSGFDVDGGDSPRGAVDAAPPLDAAATVVLEDCVAVVVPGFAGGN